MLYALSHLDLKKSPEIEQELQNALEFLKKGIEKRGVVAAPDGTLDYPTYSTPMVLVAVKRANLKLESSLRSTLESYLLQAQLGATRKIPTNSVHYGAWDMHSHVDAGAVTTGGNLSVTCFALEALESLGNPSAPIANRTSLQEARSTAIEWLTRCQKVGDAGGFPFTPDALSTNNKAGWNDAEKLHPRSYGSATCDGLRGFRYAGVPDEDPRVRDAVSWIVSNAKSLGHPGFGGDEVSRVYGAALWRYYQFTLAKSLSYLPSESAEVLARQICEGMCATQTESGAWVNSSPLMREDDPLIATSFSLIALACATQYLENSKSP